MRSTLIDHCIAKPRHISTNEIVYPTSDMMAKALLLLQLVSWLLCTLDLSAATIDPVAWEKCECRFAEWNEWSDCTSDCYGIRTRTRGVWLNPNICDEFEDCAPRSYASDEQDCNQVCQNGGTPSTSQCNCLAGYTGTCCSSRLTCGIPDSIANGHVTNTGVYYGDTSSYSCDVHYQLTGGNDVRTCGLSGMWDGVKPRCAYVNHCSSEPCQNGATCTNLLDDYSCTCPDGWSGQHCEQDVQPPVMSGCLSDFRENATAHSHYVEWEKPSFIDPMGNEITVTANYPSPAYTFPYWDDFTVQYVATKPSNGLQTECQFSIGVRPTPCTELNIPTNGARVCNGFRSDYGQYCMVVCQSGWTIDPTLAEYETLYVCGASGNWIANGPLPDCSLQRDVIDIVGDQPSYEAYSYNASSCYDPDVKAALQQHFIDVISAPDSFTEVCSDHPDDCIPENVIVEC